MTTPSNERITMKELPRQLEVPAWDREPEPVEVEASHKVAGVGVATFRGVARGTAPNRVMLEGVATLRGTEYRLSYVHAALTPAGWWLVGYGNDRDNASPQEPGTWQERRALFSPYGAGGPKSDAWASAIAGAARDAAAAYVAEHGEHQRAGARANLVHDVNRHASTYNDKAAELARLLDKHAAAVQDLSDWDHLAAMGPLS